jgi:hypothetical protein
MMIDKKEIFDKVLENRQKEYFLDHETKEESFFHFIDQNLLNLKFDVDCVSKELEKRKSRLFDRFKQVEFKNSFEKIKAYHFLDLGRTSIYIERFDPPELGDHNSFKLYENCDRHKVFPIVQNICENILEVERALGQNDNSNDYINRFHVFLKERIESKDYKFEVYLLERIYERVGDKTYYYLNKLIDDVISSGYKNITINW